MRIVYKKDEKKVYRSKLAVKKGLFIVLEGIDNCGKTTQSKLLSEYFKNRGFKVVQEREPGGTKIGEEIREVLLKVRDKMLDPITQTLLFYAARAEFVKEIVLPNLKKGQIVITDRFEASTFVYQGIAQKVNLKLIEELSFNIVHQQNASPDLYVILDISAEESMKRGNNGDRKSQNLIYEKQGFFFMKKVRNAYLKFAKGKKGVVVVAASKSKEKVHEEILDLLTKKGLIKR